MKKRIKMYGSGKQPKAPKAPKAPKQPEKKRQPYWAPFRPARDSALTFGFEVTVGKD